MTQIVLPPSRAMLALLVVLVWHADVSRRGQRRHYRRMHRALRRHGLVLCQTAGICLVVPLSASDAMDDRRRVVDWLVDQPGIAEITLHLPRPATEFLQPDLEIHDTDGSALGAQVQSELRGMLRKLLFGALLQRVTRLRMPRPQA